MKDADQNYKFYLGLNKEYSLKPRLLEKEFLSIKEKTVKFADNITKEWNSREEEEFSRITSESYSIYRNLKNSFY